MTSIITDAGLVEKAKLLNGISTAPFTVMALGSGSAAPAAEQTELATEITTNGGARKEATVGYEAGNKAVWSAVFSFTGPLTVRELGILNNLSGGTLYLRHVWDADKNVENGENILFTVRSTETRVV